MSDLPTQLPPKKEVALALLEGPSLFIHLDPRREGVVVPKWFMGQPQLVLQVGLNMAVAIPDLAVDEEGITCTLSFSRTPFWCRLPWNAVYALVGEDGRGMLWPKDVPPEVAAQMQKAASTPAPAKTGKKAKPKLTAVKEGSEPRSQRPGARSRGAQASKSTAAEPPERETAEQEAPEAEQESNEAPPMEGGAARRIERGGGQRKGPRLAVAPEPSAEPPAAEAKEAADAKDTKDAKEAKEEPHEPSKARKPLPGDRKPKRELPPYLRVIK